MSPYTKELVGIAVLLLIAFIGILMLTRKHDNQLDTDELFRDDPEQLRHNAAHPDKRCGKCPIEVHHRATLTDRRRK